MYSRRYTMPHLAQPVPDERTSGKELRAGVELPHVRDNLLQVTNEER